MKRRLFVGNLAPTVTRDELHEKFTSLLNGHQDCHVGNVEIRCKNEDNYFGFVDVHLTGADAETAEGPPYFLRKCIDLMNNTKWKGCLIKVQLAKESFLDKLKKEREGNTQPSSKQDKSGQFPTDRQDAHDRFPKSRFDRYPKKPDNFDFEIVANKIQGSQDDEKGNNENDSDDDSEDESPEGIPRFRGLSFFYPTGLPENNPHENINNQTSLNKKENLPDIKVVEPISVEDDERFQRLQRIAGYPISIGGPSKTIHKIAPMTNQMTQLKKENFNTAAPTSDAPKGVVFRKHKQQNSDMLRQQSFDKMKEARDNRINIVKSSLAQTNNNFNFGGGESSSNTKKPKIDLFGEEDQEDNYEEDFKLKKQYEGAKGQKLLELRGQFAFDDRFNIDERFKDGEENESILPTEEEKRKQMSILSDLLGTTVTLQAKPEKKNTLNKTVNKNPVILDRYDPENHQDNELVVDKDESYKGKDEKRKKPNFHKSVEDEKLVVAEPIRSSEPATYKTASNLKSLFSEDNTKRSNDGGFSLLATFGQEENHVSTSITDSNNSAVQNTNTNGAPRQFWQANPFKYDSSDDEDDDENGTRIKKIKSSEKVATVKLPGAPVVIPKCDFFYHKNDIRFSGLEDYFMKRDETVGRIDYDEKRRELKSIVKAKARNAKRKDEKRTLAIKRAIRKKRKYRKTLINKISSSNSVKLGG